MVAVRALAGIAERVPASAGPAPAAESSARGGQA
jgi:hypothetical protein